MQCRGKREEMPAELSMAAALAEAHGINADAHGKNQEYQNASYAVQWQIGILESTEDAHQRVCQLEHPPCDAGVNEKKRRRTQVIESI
jgi:hypothetical protein